MSINALEMRGLSDREADKLKPGDEHYRSYVGPPGRYDLMSAMQFRLLATLGLRETHRVLDFGCGSLRAGRLLIPYLQPNCYYGIDPNQWLIEDGINRQLGQDIVRIKCPRFSNKDDFSVPFDDVVFNFVLAQSIFSHTGLDLANKILREYARVLAPHGLVLATFSVSEEDEDFTGSGWVYPKCVRFRVASILELASRAGLAAILIPFYHPSQRWFLMAHDQGDLPQVEHLSLLTGAVFNVQDFLPSLTVRSKSGGAQVEGNQC